MNELRIEYKLYALDLNREGINEASKVRFCRITPFYILLYLSGEAPTGAIEITETDTHRLTAADEQWLLDCNIVLLAEEAKKNERKIAEDMEQRIARLESALREEKEKLEAGGEQSV